MLKGIFGVVAGPRLGGKTTSAGTLPGHTILLQAAVHESGSRSAQALARKRGNKLEVWTFTDLVDFRAKMEKASATSADHIFIDGFTAINDMRWGEPDVQKAYQRNNFEGYAKHGQDVSALCLWVKSFTEGARAKNVWITCSLKKKDDDMVMEAKGQMAVTSLTKLGEVVVTVNQFPSEHGPRRVMITKTIDCWPGRIDGVLDDENPGHIQPDLATIINLALYGTEPQADTKEFAA